jgi:hypothetical protein
MNYGQRWPAERRDFSADWRIKRKRDFGLATGEKQSNRPQKSFCHLARTGDVALLSAF